MLMRSSLRAVVVGSALIGLWPATHLAGQASDQWVGTWKLNLAKSVYQLGPPPKTQMQVYEPFGDGLRVSVETITDNGTRIAYGYAARLDGQEHLITGELTPNGAKTIALRVRDSFIIEATLRRGADVVLTTRIVLSQDGTVLTITSKGTNLKELPTNSVTVFDKQ